MKCLSTLVRLRSVAIASGILLLLSASIASAGRSTYIYDESGRLRTVIFPDGTRKEYVLDASGNRNSTQVALPIGGVLALSSTSVSVNEGAGTVQLTVNRSGSTTGSVSVNYATANGSAVLGSDYTQTTGTLTWPAGNAAAKTISIPIVNDSVPELQESFSISLTNSTGGAVIGANSSATITINDNDAPIFSIANQSGTEASGTINFNVSLSPAPAQAYTVNYSTSNGTADASDFTATSGTLTFGINQTSATISVPILQDSYFESTETFTVTLSGPSGGTTISNAVATGTITDDDAAPAFNAGGDGGGAGTEGSAFNFLISLTGARVGNYSVNYSTADQTATAGVDYVATSGTVTFTPSETFKYVTVQTLDDPITEPNETFVLNLSSPTGGATITNSQTQGYIVDNDAQPGTITLYVPGAPTGVVNETGGPVSILVQRTGGRAGPASVVCSTSNGTATAGSDFTTVSTTITWADNDGADKNCVIPIINDSLYEPSNETFTVTLSGVSGATLGSPNSVTLSIYSEDPPPPPGTLAFVGSPQVITEIDPYLFATVRRSGGSYGAVSALCTTTGGTATPGSDYVWTSQTVSWVDGDTADKTCQIPIIDDPDYEPQPDETIIVTLSNPSGSSLGAATTFTAIIISNDAQPGPGIFEISGPANFPEAGGTASFSVARTTASAGSGPASVVCSTTNGSATAGSDFVGVYQTLNWAAGDYSTKVCAVSITSDSAYEGPESFTIGLSNPTDGAMLGAVPYRVITIDDDDPAPPQAPPAPTWSSYYTYCVGLEMCWFDFEHNFTLEWNYSGGTVTRYEVEQFTNVGGLQILDVGLTTSYTVNPVALAPLMFGNDREGVTYRVRACNGSVCGNYSAYAVMTLYNPVIFGPF